MRPSTLVLSGLVLGLLAFGATLVDSRLGRAEAQAGLQARRALVARLGLSDLCLFTEARYTRHLSLADRHTPFQDHPLSLDHFPSGSIVAPPAVVRRGP